MASPTFLLDAPRAILYGRPRAGARAVLARVGELAAVRAAARHVAARGGIVEDTPVVEYLAAIEPGAEACGRLAHVRDYLPVVVL